MASSGELSSRELIRKQKTQNETPQPYFSSAYFPIAIARKTLLLGERDCHTIFVLEFLQRSSW